MELPQSHPQRLALNDEVHARPPEALAAPLRISFLALLSGAKMRDQDWQPVAQLAEQFDVVPPSPGQNHYSRDFGPFRLKWERHTEYTRYMIIADGADASDPFAEPAATALPAGWLKSLSGEVIYAAHAVVLPSTGEDDDPAEAYREIFPGHEVIGSGISGGAGAAFTDFHVHEDGFNRLVISNRRMSPALAGRQTQRILEIDTYRMLALLTLPIARSLTPRVTQWEQELAQITSAMQGVGSAQDDAALLMRLTKLEAAIESRYAETHARFSAAAAYYALVKRRTQDLREEQIPGMQTFGQFIERRLAPAMGTCEAVAARQESLSRRVSRATQLLSTRVQVKREEQSRQLLESMDRRARMQLRLQETVEGLSVAAITYYIVGLIAYLIEGLPAAWLGVSPGLVTAISIPIVLIAVVVGIRRMKKLLLRDGELE